MVVLEKGSEHGAHILSVSIMDQFSLDEETAFVRVMLLPPEWAGRRTISYVDPADADKPKTQRATVFLDEPLSL